MKTCASLCRMTSGRKGQAGANGALNFAKKGDQGIIDGGKNNMLPELETYFMSQERSVGLQKCQYDQFVYLIKRYSYKGTPLQEHMFKEICPFLGLDYKKLNEDKDEETGEAGDKHSVQYMTIKNHEIFQQGSYNIEILQCLGFLLCNHYDRQSRIDEFWQLINPEINEEVPIEKVVEILRIFIYIAILLRLKIEKSRNNDDQNQEAIQYLQKLGTSSYSIDDIPDSLVYKLMGMREDQKLENGGQISYHELFQVVNLGRCLTTYDIRISLLL
eukprot:403369833